MSKFRTKPFEIEAFQITRNKGTGEVQHEVTDWFNDENLAGRAYYQGGSEPYYTIETANGPVRANIGDWIIREPSGIGCYPCKPDVFAAKYEPSDA